MDFLSAILSHYHYVILVLFYISIVIAAVRSRAAKLEHIPGPFLAKYTDALRAYMAFKYSGREVNLYMKLHKKYGQVVRIGPRTVSVLDPRAVPVIYNVKARLSKVCKNNFAFSWIRYISSFSTSRFTISIDFQRPTIQGCWCARQRVSNPGRGYTRKVQKTNTACVLLDFIERLRTLCG